MGKLQVAIAMTLIATSGVLVSASFENYLSASQPFSDTLVAMNASVHLFPEEAHRLMQQHRHDPDFVVLDVRTPAEVATGHLPNAINIDFHHDAFPQQLRRLDPQKTYLIYCRRGVRSDRTLHLMQEIGFQNVHNLLGGTHRWQQAGLPLVHVPIPGTAASKEKEA